MLIFATINGLLTGTNTSPDERVIHLIKYSTSEAPFVYTIHNIPEHSLDMFSGEISGKIEDVVKLRHQVKGIVIFEITLNTHRLYLSIENSNASFFPFKIAIPAKLICIEIDTQTLISH